MKRFFQRWWTRQRQRRAAIYRASKSNIRGMNAPRRRSLLGRADLRRDARARRERWLRRAVLAGFVVAAGWIFWQSWIGWRIFAN